MSKEEGLFWYFFTSVVLLMLSYLATYTSSLAPEFVN